MKKDKLLKLASDLEALANSDLSGLDMLSIYKQLEKTARSKINDKRISDMVIAAIDEMKRYKL